MKYCLTFLLICGIISCNKNNDTPAPQKFDDPKASDCNCTTFNISPTNTGANYTFTPVVPDTSSTMKLTLRKDGTAFPVFDIENPKSKSYSYPILFEKCPKKTENAFFYFEWIMKGGRIIKGERFQIGE